MTGKLAIAELVREAWLLAAGAVRPTAILLAALVIAGGVYTFAAGPGAQIGSAAPAIAALSLFMVGSACSLKLYRVMLGSQTGDLWRLMHANIAVYIAFFFIGFFILFFVGAVGVALVQMSGVVDLAGEVDDDQMRTALSAMMPTPYGWVLLLVFAAGIGGLCFLALRLLVFAAATVASGQTMVFRTWGWTKGQVVPLGVAALATHVLPFLLALLVNQAVQPALGGDGAGAFLSGAVALALLLPFLLAGHGLAVAALKRLAPEKALQPGPVQA